MIGPDKLVKPIKTLSKNWLKDVKLTRTRTISGKSSLLSTLLTTSLVGLALGLQVAVDLLSGSHSAAGHLQAVDHPLNAVMYLKKKEEIVQDDHTHLLTVVDPLAAVMSPPLVAAVMPLLLVDPAMNPLAAGHLMTPPVAANPLLNLKKKERLTTRTMNLKLLNLPPLKYLLPLLNAVRPSDSAFHKL